MSSIRQILALIDDGPRVEAVLALAAQLATRHGAGVQALHAVPTSTAGAGGYLSPEAAGLAIESLNSAAPTIAPGSRIAG